MKTGTLLMSAMGIVEVIDNKGDYTLLELQNKKSPTPYIWAQNAAIQRSIDDNYKISWDWGHYFSTPESACSELLFKKTVMIKEKHIQVLYHYEGSLS